MRIDEENVLHTVLQEIHRYEKGKNDFSSLYRDVTDLHLPSLQVLSFASDLEYFKHCRFLLSVLATIFQKPHLATKFQDTILRSDQASSLSNEAFLATVKDPSLWSINQENEMLPREVHFTENVDDLTTYENVLVVETLDFLEKQITQYFEFYQNIVPSLSDQSLSQEGSDSEMMYQKLRALEIRIQRLKKTGFYQQIKASKKQIHELIPTNILKTDRLYHIVFVEYQKKWKWSDDIKTKESLARYFYFLILQELKREHFLWNGETLESPHHLLSLSLEQDRLVFVWKEKTTGIVAKHVLQAIDGYAYHKPKDLISSLDIQSYDSMSLWTIYSGLDGKPLFSTQNSLPEMIRQYLNRMQLMKLASPVLYRHYCPNCRSHNLQEKDDQTIECCSCHSHYAWVHLEEKTYLWFLRLGREA